jgi:sec-independent protein translocase protein TatB
MGPAFEDVDWRQLDPRQYDPRRIVREALATPSSGPAARDGAVRTAPERPGPSGGASPAAVTRRTYDPSVPTPFDVDAT